MVVIVPQVDGGLQHPSRNNAPLFNHQNKEPTEIVARHYIISSCILFGFCLQKALQHTCKYH